MRMGCVGWKDRHVQDICEINQSISPKKIKPYEGFDGFDAFETLKKMSLKSVKKRTRTTVWKKSLHDKKNVSNTLRFKYSMTQAQRTKKEVTRKSFRIYELLSVCMSTENDTKCVDVLFLEYLWHSYTTHRLHMLVCNATRTTKTDGVLPEICVP